MVVCNKILPIKKHRYIYTHKYTIITYNIVFTTFLYVNTLLKVALKSQKQRVKETRGKFFNSRESAKIRFIQR